MGFEELDGWLSPENIDALAEKVRVVEAAHTLELRDLRPYPLEDFLDESKRPIPCPPSRSTTSLWASTLMRTEPSAAARPPTSTSSMGCSTGIPSAGRLAPSQRM